MFLQFTLNLFHTFFYRIYCWIWTSKCYLGSNWNGCITIKKYTGWPTKMSLFFFGNNFYENKETFKIFSPQILEVYRILLLEITRESIMFYYTFSVINTMFVTCTALLYTSTASTRTLKLSTTLLSISCGIRLISFLMVSCLACGLFSQTPSFRYALRK